MFGAATAAADARRPAPSEPPSPSRGQAPFGGGASDEELLPLAKCARTRVTSLSREGVQKLGVELLTDV